MNLQTIHEHTIDVDKAYNSGFAIDVGCRGMGFSIVMADMEMQVFSFDVDEMEIPNGYDHNINFMQRAVAAKSGVVFVQDTNDPQAKYCQETGIGRAISSIALNEVYWWIKSILGRSFKVGVLKLDCEGAEYDILSDPNFKPIPEQITMEFHEHCFPSRHAEMYPKVMDNLLKYYHPIQHVRDERHGAGFNYWDSLFIRKDKL